MRELQDLETVLLETKRKLLHNPNFKAAFDNQPSALLSNSESETGAVSTRFCIESCRQELERLLFSLKKKDKGHRFGWERLKSSFLSRNLQTSVSDLHRRCRHFNSLTTIDIATLGSHTLKETREARNEQREWHYSEENERIMNWLSQFTFDARYKDILSKRHPGTGQWFLRLDKFIAWRNGNTDEPAIMWASGIRKL